jgi:hypothetical protein
MSFGFKSTIVAASLAVFAATPAASAVVLTDPGSSSAVTTITFDDPALPSGTRITNQYASKGVTFAGGSLFASTAYRNTSPIMQGTHADSFSGQRTTGTWDFIFANPTNFVGAYFEFNSRTNATFQIFRLGNLVESFTFTNPNCCTSPTFIGFSGSQFDTFRLTNVTGTDFYMENLRFASVNSAVPEPSTWMMIVLGFGFIGAAMRASKRRQRATLSYA